jgi:hypothetical protein
MGEHPTHTCPHCKDEAPRVFEGFGFNFAPGGSAPANSGVTKHDYPTGDQAVGMDADKRWAEYRAREQVKDKVREVGGNRALIRENGPDYVEYKAGGSQTVETRKKVSQELTEVLKRPAVGSQ